MPTVAAREFPPRLPLDLSACRAAPHARVLPHPACRSRLHDGLASHVTDYLPRFLARIRKVIAARIHARVLCDFPIGNFMTLLPASIDLIGILIECRMHVNTVLIRME
ncbi:hypothetical protein [Burkholderia sp. AU38729]|uniref:hypothetical protein n=1 Tax=Burkholderia sp. AU38729 TaxID=2879633 RepID=UPI001CF20740|nr:hypothetical protein [Burkholderia sp. AU38729]MCA8062212.1 hypothetical protein [Burkholderia sp. AU38729]